MTAQGLFLWVFVGIVLIYGCVFPKIDPFNFLLPTFFQHPHATVAIGCSPSDAATAWCAHLALNHLRAGGLRRSDTAVALAGHHEVDNKADQNQPTSDTNHHTNDESRVVG